MTDRDRRIVVVENLTKRYGPTTALKGISFSVRRGEIVGFLGPNGAGKTTAMKIITGYMPPTEGNVFIDGMSIFADSLACREKVGYLPEDVPLYDDMRVVSYLRYVCSLRGVPREDIPFKIDSIVEACDLAPVKGKLIGQLSKGNRQRVGIAQALVHDPAILVLDEPTVGLDPKQVVKIRELIARLRRDHTVILSTHILPEVEQMCDRVIIIHQGLIVCDRRMDALSEEGGTFLFRVRGETAAVRRWFEARGEVIRVEERGEEEAAYAVVPGRETPPHLLARGIIGEGWELYEMRRERKDLESVFLDAVMK